MEQPFSVRLGDARVRGRYDAVREVDGATVITDYKSGDVRDPVRARERARDALQLQIYALAWEAEHGSRPDAVELHFLEGDVVGRVTPTDRQLERAAQKVATVGSRHPCRRVRGHARLPGLRLVPLPAHLPGRRVRGPGYTPAGVGPRSKHHPGPRRGGARRLARAWSSSS